MSDWAPFGMIISLGRRPFLSGQLGRPFVRPQPSLSASAPGVMDSGFPLLLSSNGVSPPPFHLPVPVKLPVSNLDCETSLHPFFLMSSRKYFNYCPLFTGILWKICGYFLSGIVEKIVENVASILWSIVMKMEDFHSLLWARRFFWKKKDEKKLFSK
ncbi:MAG: hypothetical protein IPK01_15530 [Acidobacteria bacterium]|nr:hypothetical protein [Acidobacteriota bacterium]